jgi:hypothetical protein
MKLDLAAGALGFAVLLDSINLQTGDARALVLQIGLGPICGSGVCILLVAKWRGS